MCSPTSSMYFFIGAYHKHEVNQRKRYRRARTERSTNGFKTDKKKARRFEFLPYAQHFIAFWTKKFWIKDIEIVMLKYSIKPHNLSLFTHPRFGKTNPFLSLTLLTVVGILLFFSHLTTPTVSPAPPEKNSVWT